MPTIWYNQGYSVVREALAMVRDGARQAQVADLRLIASHADPTAAVLASADHGFPEPGIDRGTPDGETAYAKWCAERCFELGVDLFIVQGGQHAVARHLHLFPAPTRVALTASPEQLVTIHDKGRFYDAATNAGLPMPWSRTISSADEYDAALAALAALGLPACVKPREGVFGAGFWRLDPGYDMFDALMGGDRRRVSPQVMRDAIAQARAPVRLLAMEYLPGPEWSLDCVCDDGRLVAGVARRKRGRVQQLEVDGPIFAIARDAIALFRLSGQINVQFKAADTHGADPRLLEINPRMSGGMARTRFAGVNLPWIHAASLLGLAVPEDRATGGAMIATQDSGFVVSQGAGEAAHA